MQADNADIHKLQTGLEEIRRAACQDILARPQILSKRFPSNTDWARFTRREQAAMLVLWRAGKTPEETRGEDTDAEQQARAPPIRNRLLANCVPGKGCAEEPSAANNITPGPDWCKTSQQSGTGHNTAEARPTQPLEHKSGKKGRVGAKCKQRRDKRRVYDSLVKNGFSLAHLAFEAHFPKEVVEEVRRYYVRQKEFWSRCSMCNSTPHCEGSGSNGSVRICYRSSCYHTERLETPTWLQVRPGFSDNQESHVGS
ncbi:hypothetical protein 1 [Sanxia water strider virus 14]|uniref:hypothetical protein 1 n=1 Tax=Sanxia water strider virus 14 TaxID=1923398 RepID=UPI00090B23D4|nr:hypothetical protein 1 [Sanxia water strider virus 14]APG76420.1 hypothetical protein 1 [Sanxia water strider virus 14]